MILNRLLPNHLIPLGNVNQINEQDVLTMNGQLIDAKVYHYADQRVVSYNLLYVGYMSKCL